MHIMYINSIHSQREYIIITFIPILLKEREMEVKNLNEIIWLDCLLFLQIESNGKSETKKIPMKQYLN